MIEAAEALVSHRGILGSLVNIKPTARKESHSGHLPDSRCTALCRNQRVLVFIPFSHPDICGPRTPAGESRVCEAEDRRDITTGCERRGLGAESDEFHDLCKDLDDGWVEGSRWGIVHLALIYGL